MSGGRRRVADARCGLAVALTLAATSPAPSLNAQTATAGVAAEIVTPATIGVTAASEWLLSESPGVLALRIPGAASAGAVELAIGPASTGSVAALSEGAAAMQQLIAQITAASSSGMGVQVSGTVTNGTLNGQGVQIVMTTTGQSNGGDGFTTAVITFD